MGEEDSGTQPLLGQLRMQVGPLVVWLVQAGRLLRAAQDAQPPLRHGDHMVSTTLSAEADGMLKRLRRTFSEGVVRGRTLYVVDLHSKLALRASVEDGELTDVEVASAKPQSDRDRQEVLTQVRAGFEDDGLKPQAMEEEAPKDVEPLLVWSDDKLSIQLARPDLKRPSLRVTLFDGVRPVEQLLLRPLFLKDGSWRYEVWLLGERARLREARAQLA